MTVRVLIVDDSAFYRHRLRDILGADARIAVCGEAADGAQAIDAAHRLAPDVITMDVHMPVMDGIEAVKRILAIRQIPILMFSAFTRDGARATLDALAAGAMDFLPKQMDEIAGAREAAEALLRERVLLLAGRAARRDLIGVRDAAGEAAVNQGVTSGVLPRLVVIAASTGGPQALGRVLAALPADFPLPIVIVQHMPATFTGPFAERLDAQCSLHVSEARSGDRLVPGVVLVAPGGRQLMLAGDGAGLTVVTVEGDPAASYRPSADVTLASVARVVGGAALAVVLTGMGADGCEGARALKSAGGCVWAQDEATSVVYGMPLAIRRAGLADRILPLDAVAPSLVESAPARPRMHVAH